VLVKVIDVVYACDGILKGSVVLNLVAVAGWGLGGSVIAADCGVQSPFVRAMGCRYLRCAT